MCCGVDGIDDWRVYNPNFRNSTNAWGNIKNFAGTKNVVGMRDPVGRRVPKSCCDPNMNQVWIRATYIDWRHRQLVVSIPWLSAPLSAPSCHLLGQNKCYGSILIYVTSVISIIVGNFDCKHRCLVEKNVITAFISPSRWQDGAESLGIETTSCLCSMLLTSLLKSNINS